MQHPPPAPPHTPTPRRGPAPFCLLTPALLMPANPLSELQGSVTACGHHQAKASSLLGRASLAALHRVKHPNSPGLVAWDGCTAVLPFPR